MLKRLRNDYNRTREALDHLVGKHVPLGIFILYYIIMLPIGLLLLIPLKIYIAIKMNNMKKFIGRLNE